MNKYVKIVIFTVLTIVLGWVAKTNVWAVKKIAITPTVTVEPTVEMTPTMAVKTNFEETASGLVFNKDEIKWNGFNTIRKMIQVGVDRGVEAKTIVLLLLLPLVATIVSVLHYVVGLSGYGIFMPTMVAIVFLATGVFGGILLFATVLAISIISNSILRKFKLHFWPARSINLLFISVGTFGLMVASSYFQILSLSDLSIFPVLLMVLLVEEFTRTQLAKSRHEAFSLTLGTLILAITGALLMGIRQVQDWVIGQPEITLLLVLVINLIVGNYSGIRLLEIKRFGKAIRKK